MRIVKSFGYDFYYPEDIVYLDSATVSKLPVETVNEMNNYFQSVGGAVPVGTNSEAIIVGKQLNIARETIANFFGVSKTSVAFVPSRETALVNWLYSIQQHKNSKIITSLIEENSIVAPLIRAKSFLDLDLVFLPRDAEFNLPEAINNAVDSSTSAVVLSAITAAEGVKRDWKAIAKVCKDNNVEFILDISSIVGHEPLSFTEDNIPSLIIAEGNRGALGPQGTAFQIHNEEFLEKYNPIISGNFMVRNLTVENYKVANDATRFETGVLNYPGIVGLAKSVEILESINPEKIREYERKLFDKAISLIKNLPEIKILRDDRLQYGPILSFYFEHLDAFDIAIILEDLAKIIVRSGAVCSDLVMNNLPVNTVTRISTHIYNTEDEMKIFGETLAEIVNEMG